AEKLGLDGTETYTITGLANELTPHKLLDVKAVHENGKTIMLQVRARLDSAIEIEYFKNDGILQYVLRQYLKNNYFNALLINTKFANKRVHDISRPFHNQYKNLTEFYLDNISGQYTRTFGDLPKLHTIKRDFSP